MAPTHKQTHTHMASTSIINILNSMNSSRIEIFPAENGAKMKVAKKWTNEQKNNYIPNLTLGCMKYWKWAGRARCTPQAKDMARNEQKTKKFIKNNGPQLPHIDRAYTLCICELARQKLFATNWTYIYLNVVSYYFIPFWFIFCGQRIGFGFFTALKNLSSSI